MHLNPNYDLTLVDQCSHALLHVEAGEVLRSCKSVVAFQCVRPVFVPPRKVG